MRIVNDTEETITLRGSDLQPLANALVGQPNVGTLKPGHFIDADGVAEVAISAPADITLTFRSGVTSLGAGEADAGLRVRGDDGGLKKEGVGGGGGL